MSGTVVLFPSDLALPAAELAALGDTEPRVRRVVVLDGGGVLHAAAVGRGGGGGQGGGAGTWRV